MVHYVSVPRAQCRSTCARLDRQELPLDGSMFPDAYHSITAGGFCGVGLGSGIKAMLWGSPA